MFSSTILLYSVPFYLILHMRVLEKHIKSEHEFMPPQTRASYPSSRGEGECPACAVNPALVTHLQHL